MRTLLILILALALLPAHAVVKVVTATTDLAVIARAVGGPRVQVESLAAADQDLHRVEPRPSLVTKIAAARVVVRVGMDLDLWMDSLLRAARNAGVREGGKGYVDASDGIAALEIPTGKVDGARGDIHVFGNPHYWLDPVNGKIIARNITAGLKRVDPAGAAAYDKQYAAFVADIDDRMKAWTKQMEPLRGTPVVTYHSTWSYFITRFGLKMAGTVEEKPGIPPSAAYLQGLLTTMKRDRVRIVMTTPYYPTRFTDLLARETGATVLTLPSSAGGMKTAGDYCALFETTIAQLRAAK